MTTIWMIWWVLVVALLGIMIVGNAVSKIKWDED